MFDISFTEILVIAAVGLVVIGPERLPKVARTLGHLLGRAQRYANDVRNDIQHEMELEELKKWKTSIEGAARSVENTVRTEMSQFQQAIETEKKPSAAMTSGSPSGPVAEPSPPPHSSATTTAPPTTPPERLTPGADTTDTVIRRE
ncbi:MAG: twin-arginine translocase subunit TatB [Nitrosospira sp.]|nr:twin-arginine translocase subunit TatB [Nitrosospira sp.]